MTIRDPFKVSVYFKFSVIYKIIFYIHVIKMTFHQEQLHFPKLAHPRIFFLKSHKWIKYFVTVVISCMVEKFGPLLIIIISNFIYIYKSMYKIYVKNYCLIIPYKMLDQRKYRPQKIALEVTVTDLKHWITWFCNTY